MSERKLEKARQVRLKYPPDITKTIRKLVHLGNGKYELEEETICIYYHDALYYHDYNIRNIIQQYDNTYSYVDNKGYEVDKDIYLGEKINP